MSNEVDVAIKVFKNVIFKVWFGLADAKVYFGLSKVK